MKKYKHRGNLINIDEAEGIFLEYYNSILNKEGRIYDALELLNKELKGKGKILEIGCDIGYISIYLANLGYDVYGIDILEDKIELAKEMSKKHFNQEGGGKISFCNHNLFNDFTESKFDAILFLEVIEHIDNTGEFLLRFKHFLKDDGYVLVSTPNAFSLFYAHMYIFSSFNKVKNNIEKYAISNNNTGTAFDHISTYTLDTLMALFCKFGFTVIDYVFTNFVVVIPRPKYKEITFTKIRGKRGLAKLAKNMAVLFKIRDKDKNSIY